MQKIRKGNISKRALSLVMVLLMVFGLLPGGLFGEAVAVKAEDGVYTLEASALEAKAAGSYKDGDAVKAGTDEFFTLYMSAKTKIDSSNKTWDDDYSSGQRINFGGKADPATPKNTIAFTTKAAATVTIWWAQGGDDNREIVIYGADGTTVAAQTEGTYEKNSAYLSELRVEEAGTYYLGGLSGNNYLFKIEVEEDPAESGYIFEAADLEAKAAGSYKDGDVVKAGTEEYFSIYMSEKTKIDGSNKTWDDEYSSGQRLNFGGKAAPGTPKNCIAFTTKSSATVTIWWVQGGDDNRQMVIYEGDGTTIEAQTEGTYDKNGAYLSELKVGEAGTYYLGGLSGNNYIFKIHVEEDPIVNEYVFEATSLEAKAAGAYKDGDVVKAGTEEFFSVYMSAKTKIDGSNKTWDDEYVSTQRVNFGGKADPSTPKNCIAFTTEGTATVTIWWVQGGDDNREMAIFGADGETIAAQTEGTYEKNGVYLSELELENAGTYYLGGLTGNNYIFKIQVTDVIGEGAKEPERKDWASVADPLLGAPALDKDDDGTIVIPYTMVIGEDGADYATIIVKDSNGKELESLKAMAEGTEGSKEYSPSASGTYTFSIIASREGETDKAGKDVTFTFVLPLEKPTLISATSKGNGTALIKWTEVPEATAYAVYCDGKPVGTSETTSILVDGLTVGTKYAITVAAKRGNEEGDKSAELTVTATKDAKSEWGFTAYGPSTNLSQNGYLGNLNEDGKVTVYSEGGKGKIQPNATDGLAFYYTPISTQLNFTLRATISVDSWTYSNGQDGFGMMVTDSLAPSGNSNPFWTNLYQAVASKVEYTSDITGVKYSMKLGLGLTEKLGVNPENLELLNANKMTEVKDYIYKTTTLDLTPDKLGAPAGTYNIVGKETGKLTAHDSIVEITEFVLEIQRNNTGYFITYYDAEGNILNQIKNYDPEALDQLDKDYVYAGFFASRNARITVSDVELTTIDPKEDAPAEERPIEKITPSISTPSANIVNGEDYTLALYPNVDGTVVITVNGKEVAKDIALTGGVRYDFVAEGLELGTNNIVAVFTPDADQELGEYTELENANPITVTKTVVRSAKFTDRNIIYVSQDGTPDGKGTKANPTDVYTAVANVRPGQAIVILEGTYKLSATLRVERGIDGTETEPILFVADPKAATRPVFDFQGKCAGMVFGGNYWCIAGFDVTNSADGQKGMQISGDDNIIDNICAYHNGNTGIQISRLYGSDLFEDWPANNLVKNCTSYGNADSGYEDADGFAAKLTVGEGNVFDGCVAYNNADDGWDLYAKVETGPIGSVTIQNCVAYSNGYLEDGTNAGNGNGFKMGGESITGKHVLKNSYAFFNKSKGIDSNSCPDIQVYNCISYNNESYNVAFYTNNAANTDFFATGILSFKDATVKSGLDRGENLKPKGTQDESKYVGETNYYWDGTKTANSAGATADATWFKSLTFTKITRNADGTINMNGFLELTDAAVKGIGAVPGGEASMVITLPEADGKKEVAEEVTDTTTAETILAAVETALGKVAEATEKAIAVVKVNVAKISADVLEGISGVEVIIRLTQDNGIIWDVNGAAVSKDAVAADLTVSVNGGQIKDADLKQFLAQAEIKDTDLVKTISIAHNGDFGFTANLKFPVENKDGKVANLVWFHDGKFEVADTCVVENGYAEFPMTHASDYVIVVNDSVLEGEVEVVPELGDLSSVGLYLVILLGAACVAAGIFSKRKAR